MLTQSLVGPHAAEIQIVSRRRGVIVMFALSFAGRREALYCFLAYLLSAIPIPANAVSEPNAYVFSMSGEYAVLDRNTGRQIRTEDLWERIKDHPKGKAQLKDLGKPQIWRIMADTGGNRLFFLLGHGKKDLFYGYLVLRRDDLQFVHFIERAMPLDLTLTHLAADSNAARIYLTYWDKQGLEGKGSRITLLYDGSTYEELGQSKDSSLKVGPSFCFVDQGKKLFTSRRVFDTKTSMLIRKTRLYGKLLQLLDCEEGRVLALSKAEDQTALLTLFDVASDEVVKEIRTGMPIVGLNSGGWQLSKDAKIIIRDEIEIKKNRLIRTGKLVFLDTGTGAKLGELQVPLESPIGSGILGLSEGGDRIIYRSGRKLFVIDLKSRKLVGSVELLFSPIGVVWP